MPTFKDLNDFDFKPHLTEADLACLADARAILKTMVAKGPILSSSTSLHAYLAVTMSGLTRESFRVIFLDKRNRLISDLEVARGTVDHVSVYAREIVAKALELNATALILAHNHPSGDPTPSSCDVSMTAKIQTACEALSITLHDHVIVAGDQVVSMRVKGFLR
jgi:DNA repair protein RadC